MYKYLDDCTLELRAIIQSRAVPDSMMPFMRNALQSLMLGMTNTFPDPVKPTPVEGQ